MKNIQLTLFICSMLSIIPAISGTSIKKIYHTVVGTPYHQKIYKHEYALQNQEKLHLINDYGSITIKTNWNHKKILLTCTVQSVDQEKINTVKIAEKQTETLMALKITCPHDQPDVTIDCEVIIPADIMLDIMAHEGTIDIKQATKATTACIDSGNIIIYKSEAPIVAQITHKGSITIEHSLEHVKANTKKGDITIRDAHMTIIAHTDKGNIAVQSYDVPSTATVNLTTARGSISMAVPRSVNAEMQAHTNKGLITCEPIITLRPFSTRITKHTFDRLKREIEGTLGSGEAQIFLSSGRGNIAITETKA